jgi:hypothetical protein
MSKSLLDTKRNIRISCSRNHDHDPVWGCNCHSRQVSVPAHLQVSYDFASESLYRRLRAILPSKVRMHLHVKNTFERLIYSTVVFEYASIQVNSLGGCNKNCIVGFDLYDKLVLTCIMSYLLSSKKVNFTEEYKLIDQIPTSRPQENSQSQPCVGICYAMTKHQALKAAFTTSKVIVRGALILMDQVFAGS